MNKYVLLPLSFSFLTFITYLANLVEIETQSQINPDFVEPTTNIGNSLLSFLGTFWNMVTFRLIGVPDLVNFFINVFVVYPIVVFTVYLVFAWARGTD